MLISYNGTIFNRATEEKRCIYLNEGTAELQQIQEHLEVNVAGNILFCDAMPVVRTIGQGSRQWRVKSTQTDHKHLTGDRHTINWPAEYAEIGGLKQDKSMNIDNKYRHRSRRRRSETESKENMTRQSHRKT